MYFTQWFIWFDILFVPNLAPILREVWHLTSCNLSKYKSLAVAVCLYYTWQYQNLLKSCLCAARGGPKFMPQRICVLSYICGLNLEVPTYLVGSWAPWPKPHIHTHTHTPLTLESNKSSNKSNASNPSFACFARPPLVLVRNQPWPTSDE
jgi:hypothetical protein